MREMTMVSIFSYVVGTAVVLLIFLFSYWVFWRFYFLRDPPRKVPLGKGLVSPADGRVISIRSYDFKKLGKDAIRIDKGIGRIHALASDVAAKVTVISIFMSPFDVHVNRSPAEGKVISAKHTKGRFYHAGDLEKSLMNEKNEILFDVSFGRMKVIQIAGFLARRIECYVRKDQVVARGQRIGLINLGSQVTLILPKMKTEVLVAVGDRVIAGKSVIAEVAE